MKTRHNEQVFFNFNALSLLNVDTDSADFVVNVSACRAIATARFLTRSE